MIDRRQAGSGQERRGARAGGDLIGVDVIAWAAETKVLLDAIAAGSAKHAWIPDRATTLTSSGNATSISDLWGAANQVQATGASQPAYVANGGPGNRPHIAPQDNARFLEATTALAAGGRHGICLVAAAPNVADTRVIRSLGGGGANVATMVVTAGAVAFFTRGVTVGQQSASVVTPANDFGFHRYDWRPLATGWRSEIDGVLTTPTWTGPPTEAINEITTLAIGGNGGASGGKIAALFVIDDPIDTKKAVMTAQLLKLFGPIP